MDFLGVASELLSNYLGTAFDLERPTFSSVLSSNALYNMSCDQLFVSI